MTATCRRGVGLDGEVWVEVAMMLVWSAEDGTLGNGHDDDGGRVRVSRSRCFLITLFVYSVTCP